jgi:hypothetical protein
MKMLKIGKAKRLKGLTHEGRGEISLIRILLKDFKEIIIRVINLITHLKTKMQEQQHSTIKILVKGNH